MAIIKKFSPFQNLSNFSTFVDDDNPNSEYFKITEFKETFTGGKNGFLIEGCPELKESSEVKIELLDVEGNPIYFEPGDGIPEYYEGTSKLISVHVYEDTPIGLGKITILGELKQYKDSFGALVDIPNEWRGVYNVKWERTFQVNKNLSNETTVRFYKRPSVTITELIKPIFSKSIPTVTDTGYVHGFSITPSEGENITTWRAGTSYGLQKTSGSWDVDVDENIINISSLNYSPKIIEVLDSKQVLVDIPYTENNIVKNFESGSYSVTYTDFQNQVVGETSLTGSFAKIDISKLKTFVGDVARVKVFRKSRNAVGDFQFVQESKLESSELLRDITTTSDTELSYGRFDENNLTNYWVTSSDSHPTSINSDVLSQAVKIDYDENVGGVQRLITSESISVSSDVEYTLNFRTLLSGSLDDSGKTIKAFFSSSNFTQEFTTISGSAIYRARQNISENIISQHTGDAKLVFEVEGSDWYISNVSLRNAQESSFSPDEFTLIQDIPRKTASETFDFRFEFYDINNNYIPVDVSAVGVFTGGNDFPTSAKLLTFESDRNAFRFSSGSVQNPKNQQIQLKITQNNLTGSILFESSAFDVDGNYLNPSDYTQYPGLLTGVNPAGGLITINNFTGSRTDNSSTPFVGSIIYTASLENLQEFETVYRLEDGDNAPQLIVTSNANQFTYEPTALEPKPSGQSITVRAQRKNLASLITPIEINSGSNKPKLNYVDTVNGIDTYTISATAFSSSFSQNNFDEVTYSFTGSDVFGNLQSDEITLSKVVNFDGVSITLSNESTAFRSNGKGVVLDDFEAGDGIVEVRIANKEIQHDDESGDGIQNPNTFDIVSAVATNVNEAYPSYLTNEYGIEALTADSGSLVLNIKYLAGDGVSSQSFQKKVNYTKNRIAGPSIIIDTTNKTQNVDAKSTGVQITSFDDSTITVREFYTGSVTTFSSSDVAISFDSNPNTIATDNGDLTLSYNNLGDITNSTQVQFTATVTDSEGTSRSVSDSISLSKTHDSAPNVEFQVTPSAQAIPSNSRGSGSASPISLTITANEGGSPRTLTDLEVTNETNGITTGTPVLATGVIPITSTASDMTSDSGVITIEASTLNTEGTTIIRTVSATVSRVRSSAPVVDVSATGLTQTITANSIGSGSISPQTITVSAVDGAQNVFDSVTITPNGGLSGNVSGNTITFTDTASDMNSDTETISIVVNYTDSEGTTGSKNLTSTISRVRTAAPSTDIRITPVAQSILSSSAAYATADDISVTVSEGGNDYTYSTAELSGGTSEANEFRITSQDGTNASVDGASVGTVEPPEITSDSGLNGTITVEYVNSEGVLFTGKTVNYDVSVSKEGINGNDAKTIDLSASSLIFTEATNGTVSPDYIKLSVNKQNTSETVSWTTSPSVTLYDSPTGGSITTTGDAVYLRKGNFGSNTLVQITATCDGIDDSVSISRVLDGSNAITVTNSNSTHTFEADDYGEVQAYTNSGTDINVYEGATQLDYDGSGTTAGHWNISATASPNNITIGTITDVTNTARVGVHSEMVDTTDSVLITYSITGKKLNGDSFSTLTTQALGKNKAPKPPLSDTAIKIESWDASPFDTSPGTTAAPTIAASHYGLFTTGGSAITSTALRKYNTVGFLSLDGNAVSSNNFSTNINTYLLKTAEVGDIVVLYSDENNYGNYTLAAKTKVAATGDTTIQLTHISSAGRLTPNDLTYVGFGRVLIGPGVVYRGEYDSDTTYYYTETRRDIVGYDGSYYLASNTSDSGTSNWGTPGSSTDWEEFGAEFSSVATDILFAQDVYANRTVNIGSDTGNPVIALNSDDANSNENPYISIGAANYGGNGVWLGFEGGTAKTSFVNGTTSFMKWNGSTLDIKGNLTIAGESSPLDSTQITNQEDPMGGGTLNYNPDFTIVANDGRPSGVKAVWGSTDPNNISYLDTERTILKLHSSTDNTIGAGLPAIKVNPDSSYIIDFRVKSNTSSDNGLYFLMCEYNDELPSGKTHISHIESGESSPGEAGVIDADQVADAGSATNLSVVTENFDMEILIPNIVDSVDDNKSILYDGPITTDWVHYRVKYKTTQDDVKWVSPVLLNNVSMGTNELHVDRLSIIMDTSDKEQGTVGGWKITSDQIQGGNPTGGGSGLFTTRGMILGSSGWISARQFYIDASGNARFTGTVQGGTIDGGTIIGGSISVPSLDNPHFSVDSAGNMSAQDANISGSFNIESGKLGNWVVDPSEIGGMLRDETSQIRLDPLSKEISLLTLQEDDTFLKRISIKSADEWTDIETVDIVLDMQDTGFTNPSGVISATGSSDWVYGDYQAQNYATNGGSDVVANLTATTYNISNIRTLDEMKVTSPTGTLASTSEYDEEFYSTNRSYTTPKFHKLQFFFEAVKVDDQGDPVNPDVVYRTLLFEVISSGAYSWQYWNTYLNDDAGAFFTYELDIDNDVSFYDRNYDTTSANSEWSSFKVIKDAAIQIEEVGNYKFRYSFRLSSKSGITQNRLSNGQLTAIEYHQTTATVQTLGQAEEDVSIIVPTNIIEMSGNGLQIVQNSNAYLRLNRANAEDYAERLSSNVPEPLIEVKGGAINITRGEFTFTTESLETAGPAEFLTVEGQARIESLWVSDEVPDDQLANEWSRNPNKIGVANHLVPADNYINLGNEYWKDDGPPYDDFKAFYHASIQRIDTDYLKVWNLGGSPVTITGNLNVNGLINDSDRRLKNNISGSDLGLDFINNLNPVSYIMNDDVEGKPRYGLIAQEVSESLAYVGKHTDEFSGFIRDELYTSGSSESGSKVITKTKKEIESNERRYGSIDDWEYSDDTLKLGYIQFISPMIKAIQELSEKVSQLESQISGSL